MLHKTKFRRKATRIAVAEIMIPIILIIVLGITVFAFVFKLISLGNESDELYGFSSLEERTEMKWIINLSVVIALSILDLTMAYFIYTGIKEKSYNKCRTWVRLQITVLCLFTFAVIKRCSASAGGFEMFEFIILCVCIYIYKIHHVTFVYGLLEGLRLTPSKKNPNKLSSRDSGRIWKRNIPIPPTTDRSASSESRKGKFDMVVPVPVPTSTVKTENEPTELTEPITRITSL